MKIHEYKTKILKDSHKMVLVGFKTAYSNYNKTPQIVFYFVDSKNVLYEHYQICKSDLGCDVQIKKWFANLGYNMKDRDPMDLLIDFNTTKKFQDTILSKALGRVYKGTIVKRTMKWVDKEGKTKRKVFFDIDRVINTWDHNQEVLIRQFKEESILPEIYSNWVGRFHEVQLQLERADYAALKFIPAWELKEEELLGMMH